jgi:outer membrane immunogenic protein
LLCWFERGRTYRSGPHHNQHNRGKFHSGRCSIIDSITAVKLRPQGFIGGGQAGCNYQTGVFVTGLEVDGAWMTGSDSRRVVVGPNPTTLNPDNYIANKTKNSYLATVRARIGGAFDQVLVYATGGAAFGGLRTTDTLATFGGAAVSTVHTTEDRIGWTAGAGVEYAFAANWTVRGEYLYVDLGKFDVSIPCLNSCLASPTDMIVHHRYTDHVVRFGLNYRFGW